MILLLEITKRETTGAPRDARRVQGVRPSQVRQETQTKKWYSQRNSLMFRSLLLRQHKNSIQKSMVETSPIVETHCQQENTVETHGS